MATSSEAVKRLVYRTDVQGTDETVRRLGSVAAAQGGIASAMVVAGSRSAELQQRYDRLTRQQVDYARIIAASTAAVAASTAATMQATAANDNHATKSSHLSDVLRVGTKAAIDHAASWLATAGAIGAGALVLGGLLAILGPIILAYKLVAGAIGLAADAWRLGGDELDRYRKIAEDAAKVDLSTTIYQKLTKGAEAAKVPVDALTAALTSLKKASDEQLGGSALQNRLDASVKAGNFSGNSGVQQYAQANTTEQRYQAIVSLINQAMTAGQRLAALDIANTAFGPQAVENLRKDSEYLDKIAVAAAKVTDKQIVSAEDVGRALDLQKRYEAAVAILETRWHPVQDLLTQAGIEFRANWVATVETIAQGVDWATKLVAKLGDAPSWFQKKLNEGGHWITDNTTTPESRKASEQQYGITSDPAEMAKGTDAYAIAVGKLRAGLQDQAEQQRKVAEANTIAQKTLGDTSKEIKTNKTATEEQADAYDRALEGVIKHTARMQADTIAVGLGAGALEEYRVRTQLTMAAQLSGREQTAALTAEIEKQALAAGAAGRALALVRAQSQAKFASQTLFMSQSDLAAAQVMKNLYGDEWQSHMNDALAKQIKMNNLLQQVGDLASTAFSSIARDIANGIAPMEAVAKAAKSAAESVLDIAAKQIVGNILGNLTGDLLGGTAAQTAGATTSATILTSAGATVAASIIAGATEAAAILGLTVPAAATSLPIAGAVTGTEVAAGGVAAGAALAVGGTTAGAALWGPLALLAAAVAAIGALSIFGGGDEKKKQEAARVQALNNRATLASLDQTTLEGQLTAFDLNANVERTALPNGGRTERDWTNTLTFGLFGDSGGEQSQESIALERALAAERIRVIEDFNKKAIETEKQRVEAATKMMNDAVAMLQNVTLSDTAERLKDIQDASKDLSSALAELGQSTDSVATQVKAAMDDLRQTFTDSLTARLNDAIGRGYVNDAMTLIRQRAQDLKDAASIGLSDYQVGIVFRAEAQKIVDDAGLVGEAFTQFTTMFPDLAGVVTEASGDIAAAVKQQQDALNASAKSIVEYVNGLTAGSESTLSPQDRLAAAQSQYSANLALAQGGNLDAQNSITDSAENLRTAAREMYGSTAAYQAIENSLKSQLLALPAVQQATDPVVVAMRDVLVAVQATNSQLTANQVGILTELGLNRSAIATLQGALVVALAANSPSAIAGAFLSSGAAGLTFDQFRAGFPPGLATDSTLQGLYGALDTNKNGIISQLELLQAALKPAIDSGNAASIASALSTYFNTIATNTDAGITLSDMQVALAGMASVGALRDMFTRLDTDASGSLDRLELIKNASQSTSAFSADAAYYQQQSNIILDYANSLSGSAVNIAGAAYGLLASINGLQSTASQQLTLLTTQYGSAVTSIGSSFVQNLGNISANNTVMSALNKIALNTYATSMNTAYIGQSGYRGWNYAIGTYAQGGWITGGTPGVDSVPLNGGRALGMPGEFVVNYDVAQANKSWLPDFNETGRLPQRVAAPPAYRSGNDNRSGSSVEGLSPKDLAELARVLGMHLGQQTEALAARLDALADEMRSTKVETIVKQKAPAAAGGRMNR